LQSTPVSQKTKSSSRDDLFKQTINIVLSKRSPVLKGIFSIVEDIRLMAILSQNLTRLFDLNLSCERHVLRYPNDGLAVVVLECSD